MEFAVLGPLEVRAGTEPVPLGGWRTGCLLAALLLEANRVVSVDHLVQAAWADHPPATARIQVQNRISALRQRLRTAGFGTDVVTTVGSGYLIRIADGQLDLHRFDRLTADADTALAAGRPAEAAEHLAAALALWRGPALDGLATPYLQTAARGLEERRLRTQERRIQLDLDLGRHSELIGELAQLVAAHPTRESLRAALMLALHRSGRQADALGDLREYRRWLAAEQGLDPGRELIELEQGILRDDPALTGPATAGEARAPAADPRPPAELPADIAGFAGRGAQLKALDALLPADDRAEPAPVVVAIIAGTAGVGKTTLAVHWAHQVAERFPDGQLYLNLRGYELDEPVRPIEALTALLRSLGVAAEQVPVDVAGAAALYRSTLAGRQMLVLLDNAGSVDQVRPLLPGGPGCLVLVTSRDRLGGLVAREGAHRLTLDVLAPEEAYDLLARVLGAERVRAERRAAADLAELCAHLPLALRIAAAQLTDRPYRSIAEQVADLRAGDQLSALAVDGDADVAVRAAFDLSYRTIPPAAQRLFRLLGLVPGPDVTVAAAAALAGEPVTEVAAGLDRLAGTHLVEEHAQDRFRLHDLLRRYAAERCAAEDDAAARQAAFARLLDHYLAGVGAAAQLIYPDKLRLPAGTVSGGPAPSPPGFTDDAQALVWLDAERANLVAAVRQAAAHGPRRAAWLLADALRGYFYLRLTTVDWLAATQAALAAAEADGEPMAEAAAQLSLADACWRLNQLPEALDRSRRGLDLARQAGWVDGHAAALRNLARGAWEAGLLSRAVDLLTEGLALNRRVGNRAGQAIDLASLGLVYSELGRLAEAADCYDEALELRREFNDPSRDSLLRGNLGEILHMLGRYPEARSALNRGLRRAREARDKAAEADVLRCLAGLHRDTGRHDTARDTAAQALTMWRDIGYQRGITDATNTYATVLLACGHAREAARHHAEAAETPARYPRTEALIGLAAARARLGETHTAIADATRALELATGSGFRALEGHAHTVLAELHHDLGERDAAVANARQALGTQRQTGHRLGEARALAVLGKALGDEALLRAARELTAEIGAAAAL